MNNPAATYPYATQTPGNDVVVATLLLCLFIAAYIVAAAYTLFHCAGVKKMRKKGMYLTGIMLIPFLGTVLYWKNRVDVLSDAAAADEPAPGSDTRPPIPKAPDKYSSPPKPAQPPRYSTIPPFEGFENAPRHSLPPFATRPPFEIPENKPPQTPPPADTPADTDAPASDPAKDGTKPGDS